MSILTIILGEVIEIIINQMQGNNVIKRALTNNKTDLLSTNQKREDNFKAICQNFRNNFEANIKEVNRTIIRNQCRIFFLRDESDKDLT